MKSIDYGKIIHRSWALTRENKWLWVFGMVLALFGGSSSSGGSGGSGSSSNVSQSATPSASLQNPGKIINGLFGFVRQLFSSVPQSTWMLLGIGILLSVLLAIIVTWILRDWASACLITGMDDADRGKIVNLKTISPRGLERTKYLIFSDIIVIGIIFGLLLAGGLLIGIGLLVFMFSPVLQMIWGVLTGIIALMAFIITVVGLVFMTAFAQRLIVLKDLSAWPALKQTFSMLRKIVLPVLVMGFINSSIGCIAGCLGLIVILIALIIPGIIIALPVITHGIVALNAVQVIGFILLIMIFIAANLLLKTILVVFNYGTWNLLFRQIIEEGNE
jgi:hypothetical protein